MTRLVLILALSALAAPAFALTEDQMREPGSAKSWNEQDLAAKERDIENKLDEKHMDNSASTIAAVEDCITGQLSLVVDEDTGGESPAIMDLLEDCTL